jgi:hypothetical protein
MAMVVSGQLEGEITVQHFERYAALGAKSQKSLREITRFAIILVPLTLCVTRLQMVDFAPTSNG